MKNYYIACFILLLLGSCKPTITSYEDIGIDPPIVPEYAGVTIPQNIAPLNFYVDDYCQQIEVRFLIGDEEQFVYYSKHFTDLPPKRWRALLQKAYEQKQPIRIEIAKEVKKKWLKYNPIQIQVAEEIDPYIAYRLIEPGYVGWYIMGIYQRNLTDFEESPIMENTLTEKNCMNCHAFANYSPDRFSFHMRGSIAGTVLAKDGKLTLLDTKTDLTSTTFTYPSWHPSGKFIAYSTNKTWQLFHALKEKQVEVYDEYSDIVLYDVENNRVIIDSTLCSPAKFETYPSWSPDGRRLYFCTTDSVSVPDNFKQLQYTICSIGFDPATMQFDGKIDTVYNPAGSNIFPRISPDGRFLLCTHLDYGCFPIWHKEADLRMIDLQTGEEIPGDANSDASESYHSWSSNGKWVMFTSRRNSGLFTKLYFSYVSPEGKMHKAFLLPQKTFDVNAPRLKSYNVPEFISGKVNVSPYAIERCARSTPVKVQAKRSTEKI